MKYMISFLKVSIEVTGKSYGSKSFPAISTSKVVNIYTNQAILHFTPNRSTY